MKLLFEGVRGSRNLNIDLARICRSARQKVDFAIVTEAKSPAWSIDKNRIGFFSKWVICSAAAFLASTNGSFQTLNDPLCSPR
jgi:hypothetical protein